MGLNSNYEKIIDIIQNHEVYYVHHYDDMSNRGIGIEVKYYQRPFGISKTFNFCLLARDLLSPDDEVYDIVRGLKISVERYISKFGRRSLG